MSKMSKAVAKQQEVNSLRLDETVTNFMGGDSYTINPLDTLKMITASSIFGEPSYYRDSKSSKRYLYKINPVLSEFDIMFKEYENKTTNQIFEDATKIIVKCLINGIFKYLISGFIFILFKHNIKF